MASVEFNTLDSTGRISETDDYHTISSDKPSFCTKYKGFIVVFGGLCIQLGVAWHAVFGNYLPYMSSLMTSKNIDLSNSTDAYIAERYNYYTDEISWTYSIWVIIYSLTMGVGGKIEYKYGPKTVTILGSIFIILGLILSYLVFEYTS
eukprot:177924_1